MWVECSPIDPENGFQSLVESYQTQKIVFDASLLNTQHYKVRKGKKWRFTLHHGVGEAAEKGDFGSPSTTVANFIYLHIYISGHRL